MSDFSLTSVLPRLIGLHRSDQTGALTRPQGHAVRQSQFRGLFANLLGKRVLGGEGKNRVLLESHLGMNRFSHWRAQLLVNALVRPSAAIERCAFVLKKFWERGLGGVVPLWMPIEAISD